VLVAISIPIFTAQLEKSREATDLANLRSAYVAVMAAGLTETSSDDIAKANTDKIKYGNDRPGKAQTTLLVMTQQI
jgi:type IV pilus assembly protein PilA